MEYIKKFTFLLLELEKKYSLDFSITETEKNLIKITNQNLFMNVRDIAYLDQEHLRKKTFYRSSNLSKYSGSKELERFLTENEIKTIIDLRSENEPDYASYKNISKEINIIKIPIDGQQPNNLAQLKYTDQGKKERFYEAFLRFYQMELREVFETLAYKQPGFVVHCYAGKDRTGMITALLLDLLAERGSIVTEEIITEDYLNSGSNTNEDNFKIYKKTLDEYGGSKRYLQHIGVSNESIERIIQKFIV